MEQFLFVVFIILGIILLMGIAKSLGHSFAKGFLQELNIFLEHFHKLLKQGDQNNGKKKEKK